MIIAIQVAALAMLMPKILWYQNFLAMKRNLLNSMTKGRQLRYKKESSEIMSLFSNDIYTYSTYTVFIYIEWNLSRDNLI